MSNEHVELCSHMHDFFVNSSQKQQQQQQRQQQQPEKKRKHKQKRTQKALRKKEQRGAQHQEKEIPQPTANTLKNAKKDRNRTPPKKTQKGPTLKNAKK